MARNIIAALFGVLMAGATLSATIPEKLQSQIHVVENIEQFTAVNSDVQLVKLEKKDSQKGTIVYSIGFPGHPLVAYDSDSSYWETPQDVRAVLEYPVGGGIGAVLSYVYIIAYQTTNLGDAFIIAGGIGSRYITIVVEAHGTTSFSYEAYFYGYY